VQGIFVGTFLIGLREGLEATLIVSIVAAFLKRNGKSVRPMLVGVGLAVAISIGVGVALNLLSESLPQRQQEMLETVIGAIAVVFVTTMIIWMNRNAFQLKGELEREARQAINTGGSLALALMAFLAVLKEGFETAVFLLAAAQASGGGRGWAVLGGSAGIAVAIGIGVGIYYGGLKLNLGRFFRITGVFLVLIAAGLVMSSLRTAHEAGWVTIGQQRVFDFSAWMPTRSVAGALITGMFGIPSDPRLIEVLGWVLYTVPVLTVFLWPARLAAGPRARRRLLLSTAAALGVTAIALAMFVPSGGELPGPTRAATAADGQTVSVTLRSDREARLLVVPGTADVRLEAAGEQTLDGITVDVWQAKVPTDPGLKPGTVTLAELAKLAGGRLPVGLGAARTPGPFDVQWSASTAYNVFTHSDSLVHADAASSRIATLRGGGISASKTVSVGGLAGDWATSSSDDQAAVEQIAQAPHARAEQMLWKAWLPAVLAATAAFALCCALRITRTSAGNERKQQKHGEAPQRDQIAVS
jgi:high-affinity iron transporter